MWVWVCLCVSMCVSVCMSVFACVCVFALGFCLPKPVFFFKEKKLTSPIR